MNSDRNRIGITVTRHVDRISTLPDELITNSILSLLPTRDSVRTSALSTRWKRLYASVPVLNFHHSVPDIGSDPPFISFVYNVINAVTDKLPRVPKFSIHLQHLRVPSSDLISWVDSATSRYVETLDVFGFWVERARLPRCLFTCETLVSLSLDLRFLFSVPGKVCLPNLKNLWLKNLVFGDESDDGSVRRLFSSCPVLEKLMVFSGSDYPGKVFDVSVPSLKSLYLDLYRRAEFELSVNCPNLEELECNSYATRGYSGDVFGSLKKCEIDVGLPEQQFEQGKLIELVRKVCKVHSLSLAGDSMQALLHPTASLPTFENLTRLELEAGAVNGWQLLPRMLDSSPCLKTLEFPSGFFGIYDCFRNPFPPPEHVPVCLSLHLKVIKFENFVGEEIEYKWVEYFLANALVLEKMEICLRSSEVSEEEDDPIVEGEGGGDGDRQGQEQGPGQKEEEGKSDPDFERDFEIAKRLLNFRRSSEGVKEYHKRI